MKDTHTLTRHREIRDWVTNRRGQPAIARIRDHYGDLKARLCLRFEKAQDVPASVAGIDDGMSPVSWNAWLAELDRQQLALKVSSQGKPSFEFVHRESMH